MQHGARYRLGQVLVAAARHLAEEGNAAVDHEHRLVVEQRLVLRPPPGDDRLERVWVEADLVELSVGQHEDLFDLGNDTGRDEPPPEFAQRHAHLVDHAHDVGLGALAASQEDASRLQTGFEHAGRLGVAGNLRAHFGEYAIALADRQRVPGDR